MLVTNPPYGERISVDDMDALYKSIGTVLKHVFTGYHAWIIGYRDEYFARIGLAPSSRTTLYNGSLECSLREYVIFDGDRKNFVRAGGRIGRGEAQPKATRSDERRDRRRDSFRDRDRDRKPESEPENPLARRRNPYILRKIVNNPTQPGLRGPVMRSRGWKKKSDDGAQGGTEN